MSFLCQKCHVTLKCIKFVKYIKFVLPPELWRGHKTLAIPYNLVGVQSQLSHVPPVPEWSGVPVHSRFNHCTSWLASNTRSHLAACYIIGYSPTTLVQYIQLSPYIEWMAVAVNLLIMSMTGYLELISSFTTSSNPSSALIMLIGGVRSVKKDFSNPKRSL